MELVDLPFLLSSVSDMLRVRHTLIPFTIMSGCAPDEKSTEARIEAFGSTSPEIASLDQQLERTQFEHDEKSQPINALAGTIGLMEFAISVRIVDAKGFEDLVPPYVRTRFEISDVELLSADAPMPSDLDTRISQISSVVIDGGEGSGDIVVAAHAPKFDIHSVYVLLARRTDVRGAELYVGDERQVLQRDGDAVSYRGASLTIGGLTESLQQLNRGD